jgi:hypothetical protein
MAPFAKHLEKGTKLSPLRPRALVILSILLLLPVLPCYAYGDPSGGMLFQVLMPALAALWGMWIIFADRVRRRARVLFRKMRGISTDN